MLSALLCATASCGEAGSPQVEGGTRPPGETGGDASPCANDCSELDGSVGSSTSDAAQGGGTGGGGGGGGPAEGGTGGGGATEGGTGGGSAVEDPIAILDPPCEGGHALSNAGSACNLPDTPASTGTIGLVDAFPQLSFLQPLYMTYIPDGTNRLVVVQKNAVISVFPNNPSVTPSSVFLNVANVTPGGSETGLLGLAFDPNYASNGYFYVSFTSGDLATDDLESRIVRYHVSSDPNVADPSSALEILRVDQPSGYGNHKGGMIEFGPDGYLYVALGDGGDPVYGQTTNDLLGNILRIDVHNPSGGKQYGIPADNPFASASGGMPELYAWGLRNPWRFSFDGPTGRLWVGDVGQGMYEEVDIVEKGKNYGWTTWEGNHCYQPSTNCPSAGLEPPVAEYDHGVGQCITGGYVYRGTAVPSLYGAYVFGDFESRALFSLRYDEGGGLEQLGVQAPKSVASFGVDADGELYVVGFEDSPFGKLYKFVEQPSTPFPANFPRTLTATGCFDSLSPLRVADGVNPYAVNTALWSDSSLKERYFVLPAGTRIGYSDNGRWTFPAGTTFIKNFYLDGTPGDTATRRVVETRFLKQQADGLRGYSYRWNDAQTEATLLDSGSTRDFDLTRAGSALDYVYMFPSRTQCLSCHTDEAGGILGLETGQLNRSLAYPPSCEEHNQVQWLATSGLLNATPGSSLKAYPAVTDASATVEQRARAYLHANCAQCHLPGGPSNSPMDLRFDTAFASTSTCGQVPERGDMGVANARIIDPGSPDTSVLYLRMATRGEGKMPPLASSLVDTRAAALVREWIEGLTCP